MDVTGTLLLAIDAEGRSAEFPHGGTPVLDALWFYVLETEAVINLQNELLLLLGSQVARGSFGPGSFNQVWYDKIKAEHAKTEAPTQRDAS